MNCPAKDRCGACSLLDIPYEEQLQMKQKEIKALYSGKKQLPIIGMDSPLHYRHKVYAAFGTDRKGRLRAGMYEEESHRLVPVQDCLIQHGTANAIVRETVRIAQEMRLEAWNDRTGTGTLRHLYLRISHANGDVLMVVVIGSRDLPGSKRFVREITEAFPQIRTIVLNRNSRHTSMILGDKETVIYGKGTIVDEIDGVRFRISSRSFYQVNPVQTERLYRAAIDTAELKNTDNVLDACCGIGTISLLAARKAGQVIGVEIVPQAIQDAKYNARLNGIDNASFFAMDIEAFMDQLAEKPDVVFLDPPRSGMSEKTLAALGRLAPERIVYISCYPPTQKRDSLILEKYGYRIRTVQPVDMFPYTKHIETVVQLSKGNINRDSSERKSAVRTGDMGVISVYSKGNKVPETTNVKIDFSLENLDLSELKGKATYEQIKDYVREQTGFRVSSLYISQVKRKCGLEVGESYNKPKSDDARQPQCTPEKEEAIMQALSHFGVI